MKRKTGWTKTTQYEPVPRNPKAFRVMPPGCFSPCIGVVQALTQRNWSAKTPWGDGQIGFPTRAQAAGWLIDQQQKHDKAA